MLVESGPLAPTTSYGRSKLAAEQEVIAAGGRHVIFRPSVTYGAGVVGNIARLIQFSTGHIPPPFGALHNQRSLLAVENMCQAVRFALETEAAVGQTFLLADPEPISVAEMVRLLREGAGMRGGGLRVPPAVLSALLRLFGRGDLWEKIASDLVVSVEKLRKFGFQWKVKRAKDCAPSARDREIEVKAEIRQNASKRVLFQKLGRKGGVARHGKGS